MDPCYHTDQTPTRPPLAYAYPTFQSSSPISGWHGRRRAARPEDHCLLHTAGFRGHVIRPLLPCLLPDPGPRPPPQNLPKATPPVPPHHRFPERRRQLQCVARPVHTAAAEGPHPGSAGRRAARGPRRRERGRRRGGGEGAEGRTRRRRGRRRRRDCCPSG